MPTPFYAYSCMLCVFVETVALVVGGHSFGSCHAGVSKFRGPWGLFPGQYMPLDFIGRILDFGNAYFWKDETFSNGTVLLNGYWVHKKNSATNMKGFVDPLMLLPTDAVFGSDIPFKAILAQFQADPDYFDATFASTFGKLIAFGTTSTSEIGILDCLVACVCVCSVCLRACVDSCAT
jgi:catalase (peroxidase I)